jgi:hypothetical protein
MAWDLSNFEIYAENDTHTFFNGSWKFLKDVSTPWYTHFYVERELRGSWVINSFDRNNTDYCANIHNPLDPYYYMFKNVQGCPIKAGVLKCYF